jgi:hypothetical protein
VSKGQLVTVHLFGGMTAQRRLVAQKGNIIVICSEEEYRSAERERREPCGVGFPQEDVEVLAPVCGPQANLGVLAQ